MAGVVVYRKRRGVELVMLAFGMLVPIAGYLLTDLNSGGAVPQQWPWAVGAYVGIGLFAHAVVRWRLPYADPLLVPSVYLLNGLGLAMIHRLDLGSNPVMHSAELQLGWTVIAVLAFAVVVFLLRDHRRLQRFPYLMFLAGMAILMTPLVPGLGLEKHGSRIWIHVGPWNFQPAELAKIVLSIAFASYLVEKREVLALAGARFVGIDLPRARDLGPIAIMWAASLAVLVFQKDLGTSLLFFGLFVMMLYVATERPSWPILGLLLFGFGAVLGYRYFGHVQVRVNAWLDPFSKPEQNYQIIQGQYGLAWGGLFGTGWGLGRPNLTPLAKNDFIAAALGEEIGVAGLMAIVVVYALLVARGLRAALICREPFGKLLAAGLSFVFAIQVFVIIGGVTRLLPLTGLTTPFLSQGGSSLIANWMMVGLLLTVTHQARRPQSQVVSDPVASLAHDTTQVIALTPAAAPAAAGPATVQATPDEATQITPSAGADDPTWATPAPGANDPTWATPAPGANDPTQATPAAWGAAEPTLALGPSGPAGNPSGPAVSPSVGGPSGPGTPSIPVADWSSPVSDPTANPRPVPSAPSWAPPDETDTNPRGPRA